MSAGIQSLVGKDKIFEGQDPFETCFWFKSDSTHLVYTEPSQRLDVIYQRGLARLDCRWTRGNHPGPTPTIRFRPGPISRRSVRGWTVLDFGRSTSAHRRQVEDQLLHRRPIRYRHCWYNNNNGWCFIFKLFATYLNISDVACSLQKRLQSFPILSIILCCFVDQMY